MSTTKDIWNKIKLFNGTLTNKKIVAVNSSSGILTDQADVASFFSNLWSNNSADHNFSSQFINDKNVTLQNTYTTRAPLTNPAKIIEEDISIHELDIALNQVKGTSPGLDRISNPILKNIPRCLRERIVALFNNILRTGIYPQNWKVALIVPIHKPGKALDNPDSYRPISLLPCISKLLEKIVAKRLMWYIARKNLISHHQVAFKEGQSTLDALLHFENFATNTLTHKNHATILSLDFEKAFDKIGIHILLRQLANWNVGPNIYGFVKAFLTNRKFRTKINGNYSNLAPLHNGIPQGSPISVVLFIIAFDNLSKLIAKHDVEHSIYADNVIIFSKNNDLNKVKIIFTEILDDISIWSCFSGAKLYFPNATRFTYVGKEIVHQLNFHIII